MNISSKKCLNNSNLVYLHLSGLDQNSLQNHNVQKKINELYV